MLPTNRAPTTPGEVLLEEYLAPLGMSQQAFADKLGVHVQKINGIVKGRVAVTAETAWMLARATDTTPELWAGLQMACDLWTARPNVKLAR